MGLLDGYLDDQQETPDKTKTVIDIAVKKNPDQFAAAKKSASILGVDTGFVERNPKDTEHMVKQRQIDLDALRTQAPKTHSWLGGYENAAIAHDDVDNLSALENVMTTISDVGGVIEAAPYDLATGIYGLGEVGAKFLSHHLTRPIGEAAKQIFGYDEVVDPASVVADYFKGLASETKQTSDTLTIGNKEYGLFGRSVLDGIGSGVQSLGIVGAGIALGRPDLALNTFMAQSLGSSAHDAISKGVSVDTALVHGLSQGIIEKYTEKLSIGPLIDMMKGKKGFGKQLVDFAAREMGGEQVSTVMQDLNDWATLPENKDKSFKDYLKARPEAALSTAIATAVGGSVQVSVIKGVQAIANRASEKARKVQQSEQGTQVVAKLNELASSSKLLGRSSESFQQFVAQASEDGPVQAVFIDANTLMQSGVADSIAAVSPSVAEQLDSAVATGGQISIPIDEYATKIAPTEYANTILDDIKVDSEGFSRNEADRYMQSQAEDLQQEVERTLTESKVDESFKTSANEVHNEIKSQLDTAGRFTSEVNNSYASMVSSFYSVTAAKLNTTPSDLYQRYPLKIGAESIAGPSFSQPSPTLDDDVVKQWDKSGVKSFISEKDNTIQLSKIIVPQDARGTGVGTQAMEQLVEYADRTGKRIVLSPSSDFGGSKSRLTKFYKRFGFVENKGRNKDYTTSETMLRDPAGSYSQSGINTPVSALTGNEVLDLDENPVTAVTKYFNAELRGREDVVFKDSNGVEHNVVFKTKGLKKYKHGIPHDDIKAKLLPAVPDIIQHGIYLGRDEVVDKRKDNTVAFHYFEADVAIGNEVVTTRVSVGEDSTGKYFYNARHGDDPVLQKKKDHLLTPGVSDPEAGSLNASIVNISNAVNQSHTPKVPEYDLEGKTPSEQLDLLEAAYPEQAASLSNRRGIVKMVKLKRLNKTGSMEAQEIKHELVDQIEVAKKKKDRAFTRWFGNSVVTDVKGEPKVVYHGTGANVSDSFIFDYSRIGEQGRAEGAGFYFTENKNIADGYGGKGSTLDVYLSIENPISYEQEGFDTETVRDILSKMAQAEVDKYEMGIGDGFLSNFGDVNYEGLNAVLDSAAESFTGMSALDQLSSMVGAGGDIELVNRAAYEVTGHDGVVTDGFSDQGGDKIYVAFFPEQIKSTEAIEYDKSNPDIFFQGKNARGAFNPETLSISLLKNADLSTFLHESGHFFLEAQFDIATKIQEEASVMGEFMLMESEREMLKDMDALLGWFGVSNLAEWNTLDFEKKRQYHEQYARGFEAYLFEGKSPNIEMQGLFQRFRAWMLNVYESLKNLNVELSDDVRGVFDRMLATDEQIKLAEQGRSLMPLFGSPDQAGMTTQEFAAYQALGSDATNEAIENLQGRALRDMKWLHNARSRKLKELQKEANILRADIRKGVHFEVLNQPIYRAWQFLTNKVTEHDVVGKNPTDDIGSGRLDLSSLMEMGLPSEVTDKLGSLDMVVDDGGWHPDLVADRFNLTSGDELVMKIAELNPPKDEIESITDVRMLEQYGDLSTPEAISTAADAAIHNDVRSRMVATEANALAKATGQRKVLASAAKEFAKTMIARLRVRDIRPSQYSNAEARAARAADKASRSGDLSTAAAEKRNQLVQGYAANAAHDAKAEIEKGVKFLKKFDSDGVRKNLDVDYLDQIDSMLERFDLRKAVSNKALDKRASLAEWIEAQREAGFDPDIPQELENELNRKSYKDMMVEEFRGVIDSVKQIEHLARLKHKLLTAKDKREFDAIVSEASEVIRDNGGDKRPVQLEPSGRFKSWQEGMRAGNRKLNSLFRQFDGGKDGGLLWELLGRTMNTAADNETAMIEKATERLTEIYKPILALKGGLNGNKRFIPAIGGSLTRGGRLSVALNWGNEINRKRIMDGDKWSEQQVNGILATLTETEAQFVNDVWEYIDSFWSDVAAKEKRVTGREPEKVGAESFPMIIEGGKVIDMRGGYYPIKYDAERDSKSEQQDAAEVAKDMLRGAITRSTTRRGHTKQRVEYVGRPVKKSLDVITQHVSEVVHDLAWHEWLIDSNRLMSAKPIDQAIREHYGPEIVRAIKDNLASIATADIVAKTAIDTAMMWARSNVSAATMGFSFTTSLLQPFGLAQSMVRIGPKYVLRGMARWGGDVTRLQNTMTWIGEKSQFMSNRNKTFNRELREINGRVNGDKSTARQVYEASLFMMMQKMQLVADVPTWVGAYEKALDEGNVEDRAVALADQAVLDSQGGGQIKDLSRGQIKHPLMTMFYSYFNTTYNLISESTAKTNFKQTLAVAGWVSDMMLLTVIPALAPFIVFDLLRGGSDDDPEEWAIKLARAEAGYLLGLVPLLREFSGIASGFSYSGPPAGRIFTESQRFAKQVEQGDLDEALLESAFKTLGLVTKIPTTQMVRSYKGWNAWVDGDAPVSSVLVGPPPKN